MLVVDAPGTEEWSTTQPSIATSTLQKGTHIGLADVMRTCSAASDGRMIPRVARKRAVSRAAGSSMVAGKTHCSTGDTGATSRGNSGATPSW